MEKYNLLPEQLLHEGIATNQNFFIPPIFDESIVQTVHSLEYIDKLKSLNLTKQEIRRTGFPLSRELVKREFEIAYGTVQCSLFALKDKCAFNIAGGTHHAFKEHGEGFCLLNDQAIAAQYLVDNGYVKNILIIDLDVHQGNGTAEIFYNSLNIKTLSFHGAKNYPLKKENSHYDYSFLDNTEDEEYLFKLKTVLAEFKENSQVDFVFYQAGVDVLSSDQLGRLSLTTEGCRKRDELVFQFVYELNVPVVTCMGGGYSKEISKIINAHRNTFDLGFSFFA